MRHLATASRGGREAGTSWPPASWRTSTRAAVALTISVVLLGASGLLLDVLEGERWPVTMGNFVVPGLVVGMWSYVAKWRRWSVYATALYLCFGVSCLVGWAVIFQGATEAVRMLLTTGSIAVIVMTWRAMMWQPRREP